MPKAANIFLKFGKVLPIPNALNFQLRGANWSGALSGMFSMLLEKDEIMVNPIGGIGTGGAGVAAMRVPSPPFNPNPSANAPPQASHAPKVFEHKEVELQINPAHEREKLKQAVSLLNEQVQQTNRGLGFRMDEVLNAPVVTVTSAQTGEVIRQIPNEAVIRVAHNIEKVKGMFFNGRA